MDQVRTALNWLKQHHFWVLSVLVPLIGLGCWWSASRSTSAKYQKDESTITTEFKNITQVRITPFHPNQNIIDKQHEEKKKQAESVTKLWQQLYDRQREEVLKWPTALSKSFRDTVEKLQFNDDIPSELRNNYQNYIQSHFPELPKQINARVIDTTAAGGAGGSRFGGRYGDDGGAGPGAAPVEDDHVCEWLDQGVVRDELNFPDQPSALRIWVTQEDLWVYHTLLDVIAKTNQAANATRRTNAAVKTVYSLEVGRNAALFSRQPNRLLIHPPAVAAAAGEGGVGGPGDRGPRAPMAPGGGEGGRGQGLGGNTALTPAQEQAQLLSGRYLDDKGMPVVVGGAAAGPEGGPPAPAPAATTDTGPAPPLDLAQFGVGYKRLPVRMVLQMDGRWLPQLISACANEPLRVEVQEVRVNSPDVASLDPNSAGGGGGGGRPGSFGGEGGGRGGSSGAGIFPDHTGIQNFPAHPNVVNVVIQGTIYIFNKPNKSLLQSPSDQPAVAGN